MNDATKRFGAAAADEELARRLRAEIEHLRQHDAFLRPDGDHKAPIAEREEALWKIEAEAATSAWAGS